MIRKAHIVPVVLACLMLGLALPALAQDGPPALPGEVIITDLGAPRGLSFDTNGNLLVADAGTGGEVEMTLPSPEGESVTKLGMTGRALSIAPDGTATDLLKGFPSASNGMETLGLYRVMEHNGSWWVVFSGTGPGAYGAFWTDTITEIDPATMVVKRIIHLNPFELANDPDGNGYDSNVADVAWADDGTMYIVDAGCNCLASWTEADGFSVVQAWPENPVPTSIEIADNGDFYLGFLGAGLAPGAGKIEHWSGGELVHTYEGLNAVSDILLDGDTLYAVELVIFGETGPGPGRVITVSDDGVTPVAEGIPAPFGLAKGPDGSLYVSFGTIPLGPGMTGGVLKLAAAN